MFVPPAFISTVPPVQYRPFIPPPPIFQQAYQAPLIPQFQPIPPIPPPIPSIPTPAQIIAQNADKIVEVGFRLAEFGSKGSLQCSIVSVVVLYIIWAIADNVRIDVWFWLITMIPLFAIGMLIVAGAHIGGMKLGLLVNQSIEQRKKRKEYEPV